MNMLPISNPENVVTVVNRYGFIYNVVKGSFKLLPNDTVTFAARKGGQSTKVTMLREEIGTVAEAA